MRFHPIRFAFYWFHKKPLELFSMCMFESPLVWWERENFVWNFMKLHSILTTEKKKQQQQHIEQEIDSKWNTIRLHLRQQRTEHNQMYSEKKRKHFTISSPRVTIKVSRYRFFFFISVYLPAISVLYWIRIHFLFTFTQTHAQQNRPLWNTSFNPFPLPSSNVNTFMCVAFACVIVRTHT